MNIEAGLITRIESKEDLLFVLDERITDEFFDEHSEVFRAVLDYYTKYLTVPEKETIKSLFPNFQFSDSKEPLRFFVDKIKEKYKKNLYSKGLIEVSQLLKEDVDRAERELQALLRKSKTNIKTGSDLDIRISTEDAKKRYEIKKLGLGIDGYSTPWDYLNQLTCGYHNGELIVWTAKAKKGKTWLLIDQAVHIWREYNIPVIFITKEMRPLAIQDRMCALESRLPYEAIRHGLLSDAQQKVYYDYLDSLKEEPVPFIISGYDLNDRSSGVSSIIPKIERLGEKCVLFLDGIYLMPDDRGEKDWKAIVNVSSDLKNLGLSYDIPVIATTQHNMEDKADIPRFDGVAYGKYLVQFVDALIGISRSDADKSLNQARIHVLGQREGDVGDFSINMRFNPINFDQLFEKRVKDTDDNEEVYKE